MKSGMKQVHPACSSAARKVAPLLLVFSLVACGSGGPSKSEAEDALNRMAQSVGSSLGGLMGSSLPHLNMPKLSVEDIKCTKTGDDQYTCAVLAKIDGGGEQSQDVKFTKLNGKWSVTR